MKRKSRLAASQPWFDDNGNRLVEVAQPYKPRFLTDGQANKALEYYHIARGALDNPTRYNRLQYAVKWLNKDFPDLSPTAIYKDIDGLTQF